MTRKLSWHQFVIFMLSSSMLIMAYLWYDSVHNYNGLADLNRYGEGYPEVLMWLILGISGFIELRKSLLSRTDLCQERD